MCHYGISQHFQEHSRDGTNERSWPNWFKPECVNVFWFLFAILLWKITQPLMLMWITLHLAQPGFQIRKVRKSIFAVKNKIHYRNETEIVHWSQQNENCHSIFLIMLHFVNNCKITLYALDNFCRISSNIAEVSAHFCSKFVYRWWV